MSSHGLGAGMYLISILTINFYTAVETLAL